MSACDCERAISMNNNETFSNQINLFKCVTIAYEIAKVSFKTFEIWNDQRHDVWVQNKRSAQTNQCIDNEQKKKQKTNANQHARRQTKRQSQKTEMDSCFPPLANLSLRGSSRSNKPNKNRHSTDGSAHNDSHLFYHQNNDHLRNHSEIMPKLEVLQDLDLYYVRQIASSLKVKKIWNEANEQTITWSHSVDYDDLLFTIYLFIHCLCTVLHCTALDHCLAKIVINCFKLKTE